MVYAITVTPHRRSVRSYVNPMKIAHVLLFSRSGNLNVSVNMLCHSGNTIPVAG